MAQTEEGWKGEGGVGAGCYEAGERRTQTEEKGEVGWGRGLKLIDVKQSMYKSRQEKCNGKEVTNGREAKWCESGGET